MTGKAKKSTLDRSFNLKSRKIQFIVAVLIVAILGAGYFTFKSFAGTVAYSFSPQINNLSCIPSKPGCRVETETSTDGKSSTKTLHMQAGSEASGGPGTLYQANTYRACATVRGSGQITIVGPASSVGFGILQNPVVQQHSVNTQSNLRVCNVKTASMNANASVNIRIDSGLFVVSSLDIELLSTPTTPAQPK